MILEKLGKQDGQTLSASDLVKVDNNATAIQTSINTLVPKVDNHIDNNDIHVTKSQKDNWDVAVLNTQRLINLFDELSSTLPLLDDSGNALTDDSGTPLTM